MVDRRASSLRRALSSHEPARGKRYPRALQSRIIEYARSRRAQGTSWKRIASELGLRSESIRRWCVRAERSTAIGAMRPVEIAPADGAPALAVVSPRGLRIRGVTLAVPVAVRRELG